MSGSVGKTSVVGMKTDLRWSRTTKRKQSMKWIVGFKMVESKEIEVLLVIARKEKDAF